MVDWDAWLEEIVKQEAETPALIFLKSNIENSAMVKDAEGQCWFTSMLGNWITIRPDLFETFKYEGSYKSVKFTELPEGIQSNWNRKMKNG